MFDLSWQQKAKQITLMIVPVSSGSFRYTCVKLIFVKILFCRLRFFTDVLWDDLHYSINAHQHFVQLMPIYNKHHMTHVVAECIQCSICYRNLITND